ncbi:hypothetical protein MRB53_036858 [Persea americana]|nr:hypothetical protein MRB53_036858 [Persea americana]
MTDSSSEADWTPLTHGSVHQTSFEEQQKRTNEGPSISYPCRELPQPQRWQRRCEAIWDLSIAGQGLLSSSSDRHSRIRPLRGLN